jgi:hypothetical protein
MEAVLIKHPLSIFFFFKNKAIAYYQAMAS